MKKDLWLRCETKEKEKRTPLTPKEAKELVDLGIKVTVEDDPDRIFKIEEYKDVGCIIVEPGAWKSAPKEAFVLGLKEITESGFDFFHNHIYFAHIYKGQNGSKDILKRYKKGNGCLFDLEYLTDNNGKRVAAFGHWAGFAGAAFALDRFFHKQNKENIYELQSFPSVTKLKNHISIKREKATFKNPKCIIIGSLGRCGKGAEELLKMFDIKITSWDYQETKGGGPFLEILEHDIFINAALINKKIPPFLNNDIFINNNSNLSIISDVSCDPNSDLNPIPLYKKTTTWDKPFLEIENIKDLEVLSVDNLPSTLPRESSIDFSKQLFPHLKELITSKDRLPTPFENALSVFKSHINEI